MRLVICHGEGKFSLLEPDGIRRPYTVVTMDAFCWEVAAELGLPRLFFKEKLAMMQFCLGHHLMCVTVRDGEEETDALAASFHAMGATEFRIYPE